MKFKIKIFLIIFNIFNMLYFTFCGTVILFKKLNLSANKRNEFYDCSSDVNKARIYDTDIYDILQLNGKKEKRKKWIKLFKGVRSHPSRHAHR